MKAKHLLSAVIMSFLAGSSYAADLSPLKEAIPSPQIPAWSGLYVGLNAGASWANNSYVSASTWEVYQPAFSADYVSSSFLSNSALGFSHVAAGFIGGGQVGYNLQIMEKFLSGIEADFQGIAGSSVKANRLIGSDYDDEGVPGTIVSNQKFSSNLNYLGTLRGRIGYLVLPSLMIYGTGGLAYGGVTASSDNLQLWSFGANYSDYKYTMGGNANLDSTRIGWTAGGGLEWMFLPGWSAKTEYLYYDLGCIAGSASNYQLGYKAAAGDNFLESITAFSRSMNGSIVRAGVNYHFNFASEPVVAKF